MLQSVVIFAFVSAGPADLYFQDAHPFRTLYRGPVVRLLDDSTTRLNLGLNSQQSSKLVEFMRDLDRKQDEAFSKTEDDLQRRIEMLKSGRDERQRRFLLELERAIGEGARRKLVGNAIHFWGDLAPFVVGVAEELGVSRAQRSAADDAVTRFERKRDELARTQPRPEDMQLVTKALDHELKKLVTPEQRRKAERLAGPKPNWTPDLYVEREAARQERENRPPTQEIHRDSRRLLRLVQIDDVLDEIKLKGEDRRKLLRWAKEKTEEEDSLAVLKKEDADTLELRAAKIASFDERVEKALAERLGNSKFERLQQIRWQLGGAGAVFGESLRKELGIGGGQFQSVVARLNQSVEKAIAEDADVTDELELHRRRAKRQQELDDVMLESLTEEQRKKWRRLQGEPLDKATLNRISRRL
jgi:hypothetical protein